MLAPSPSTAQDGANRTLTHVPGARDKIVFDPYHLMSYMNEAVDEVRKREHRE